MGPSRGGRERADRCRCGHVGGGDGSVAMATDPGAYQAWGGTTGRGAEMAQLAPIRHPSKLHRSAVA